MWCVVRVQSSALELSSVFDRGRRPTVLLIKVVRALCCDFYQVLYQDSYSFHSAKCLTPLSGTPIQILWCSCIWTKVCALAVYMYIVCWSYLSALMLWEKFGLVSLHYLYRSSPSAMSPSFLWHASGDYFYTFILQWYKLWLGFLYSAMSVCTVLVIALSYVEKMIGV